MLIYIITFFVVTILAFQINKSDKKNKKIILSIILLMILSLVSGLRSIELGYDAKVYIVNLYENISNSVSLNDFLNKTSLEFGFSIMSYILFKIHPDINFMLFSYSFLTTLFIILFAFNEKNEISFHTIIIIYFLTIYLHSFNLIRQCLSISIVLYSYSLYKKKKFKASFVLIILAILNHYSAIFTIPIFIINSIMSSKNSSRKKAMFFLVILSILIILCLFYKEIILFAYNCRLISYKYVSYILIFNHNDYNLSVLFVKSVWLVLIIIFAKNKKMIEENGTYITFMIIDIMITIVSIRLYPLQRITYYYYYISLFYFIPILIKYMKQTKFNKMIINMIVYGNLIVYVLWKTIIGNGYAIYPYMSDLFKWMNLI